MTISIRKLTSRIGAEVTGVDLSAPLDAETIAAIRQALNAHKAIVFDGADLDQRGQERIAGYFGDLTAAHPTVPAADGSAAVLAVDSTQSKANQWHTDVTFVVNPPAISTLRSITVPPYGGETLIADAAGAYRDLPPALRELADGAVGGALQRLRLRGAARDADREPEGVQRDLHLDGLRDGAPVVRVHPETGERGLFIGGFVRRLVGLSNTESRDLLRLLQSYVTRPENILRWSWSPGQLLIFDNRITQHYAIDNYDDQPRRLERITIAGDVPVVDRRQAVVRHHGRLEPLLEHRREPVGRMSTGFAPARVRTPSRAAAAPRERATETFTAPAGREGSRLSRVRRRVSWPLGIYTTPVAILVLWQVTSQLGWLPEKIAPAPTAIVQAGIDLWKIGELGPDLTTSLRRVGIGLAIGLDDRHLDRNHRRAAAVGGVPVQRRRADRAHDPAARDPAADDRLVRHRRADQGAADLVRRRLCRCTSTCSPRSAASTNA